jgi:hypothetical protein
MIKYLVGFAVACVFWIILLSTVTIPEYRVYDCGMSTWHPDIPAEVKEECRKRSLEHRKNEDERKNEKGADENRRNFFTT